MAANFLAITPNDGSMLPTNTALYVGGAGDVNVVGVNGAPGLFKNVAAGTILPVSIARLMATDTTATDFVLLNGT